MLTRGSVLKSPKSGTEYTLVEDIGSGSYARCWSATQSGGPEKVCIKEVFYSQFSPKEKDNALREVELHRTLENNYIIRFRESFMHVSSSEKKEPDTLIIVMDLADSSLDQVIMYRKDADLFFEIDEVLNLFVQIVSGVAYMHAFNLTHRDISCKNVLVMLKEPGNHLSQIVSVKLADFGTCKHIDSRSIDMGHTAIGTLQTMAPEVLNECGYDNKIDIWSLGCVLYEILTFESLFVGGNVVSLMRKIQEFERFDRSAEIIAKYKNHEHARILCSILVKLLAKGPQSRPSCDDILKALLNVPSFVRSPQAGSGKEKLRSRSECPRTADLRPTSAMPRRAPTADIHNAKDRSARDGEREGRSKSAMCKDDSEARPREREREGGSSHDRDRDRDKDRSRRDAHNSKKSSKNTSRALMVQFVYIDFYDGIYRIGLEPKSRHVSRSHSHNHNDPPSRGHSRSERMQSSHTKSAASLTQGASQTDDRRQTSSTHDLKDHSDRVKQARNKGSEVARFQREARRSISQLENYTNAARVPTGAPLLNGLPTSGVSSSATAAKDSHRTHHSTSSSHNKESIQQFKKEQKRKASQEFKVQFYTGLSDETIRAMEEETL
ncbi:Kinase, NEK [Giardia muris]|uniref:non-specific serine/threonine protein kinase n=1 Tax=Giardia muris TaxID=5742 RepID=A0A4Z1SVB6_GIAMU|nr:Kinase, NEK [Giardia muris]|eukprot:TNJ29600.1 Kinase, NEK [Giardia muris]